MDEILQIAIGEKPDVVIDCMKTVKDIATANGITYTEKTQSEYPELSAKDAADMMCVDWLLEHPNGGYFDWDVELFSLPTEGNVPLFGRTVGNKPSISMIVPCGRTRLLRAMKDHQLVEAEGVMIDGVLHEVDRLADELAQSYMVPRYKKNGMQKALFHFYRDYEYDLIPKASYRHFRLSVNKALGID